MQLQRSAAILVLLAGCAGPKPRPASADVELVTDDPEVQDQELARARISFPWEVNNKTSSPATVDSVDWTLNIPNEKKLSGSERPQIRAEAGTTAKGALRVEVPLSTSDEAFNNRAKDSALPFELVATFNVGTADGAVEYEASWSGELFPPQRPSVAVETQAVRYENNVELLFLLAIKNPNPFVLPIGRLLYTIHVEGTEVAKGTLALGQQVPAGSELHFDVTRMLGREDFQDLAKQLAAQQAVSYEVDTELRAAGLKFAQPISGSVEFPK